jgi:hypothetical protein
MMSASTASFKDAAWMVGPIAFAFGASASGARVLATADLDDQTKPTDRNQL